MFIERSNFSTELNENDFILFFTTLQETYDNYTELALEMSKEEHYLLMEADYELLNEGPAEFAAKVRNILVRLFEQVKRIIIKFTNYIKSSIMSLKFTTNITTNDLATFKEGSAKMPYTKLQVFRYMVPQNEFKQFVDREILLTIKRILNTLYTNMNETQRANTINQIKNNLNQFNNDIKMTRLRALEENKNETEAVITKADIIAAHREIVNAKASITQVNNWYRKIQIIYSTSTKTNNNTQNLTLAAKIVGWALNLMYKIYSSCMQVLRASGIAHKQNNKAPKNTNQQQNQQAQQTTTADPNNPANWSYNQVPTT